MADGGECDEYLILSPSTYLIFIPSQTILGGRARLLVERTTKREATAAR